ncbi:HNH endonuclease signature motif containing protein [Streptomyces sp. NPDC020125]|uniref:HNH endonuclease n=1 Tax=Streptomyces sp. NPDC020125 TaxID=3154593 RepID=UPI0033EF46D4
MTTTGLTDAGIVRRVIKEYDASGRDAFLGEHGFERANQYYLQVDGRLYDAKAIANVAYRYERQDPDAPVISGGREHSNRLLERLGFTVVDRRPTTVEGERVWRLAVWSHLQLAEDLARVPPGVVRAFGVYGGAQGVWVDKARTEAVHEGGVTMGVLHTGAHYPDDISDDDVIYHYPTTGRGHGRDESEIAATKAAAALGLPVFVVAKPTPQSNVRIVRLAWVEGWEERSRIFLITFGDNGPANILTADHSDEQPFSLTGNRSRSSRRNVRERPGQRRFKLRVFQRYGPRCPLSGIAVPEMIEAAHFRPDADDGTDDPRNGMPLNAALHRAFDAYLFAIEPETLDVVTRPEGPTLQQLGITTPHLRGLIHHPHVEALRWRYNEWLSRGGGRQVQTD